MSLTPDELALIKHLVKKNGRWLTPHDVWREEYREENGEYPTEAYA